MATCKEFNQHAKHDVAKSATFFRPTNSFCFLCLSPTNKTPSCRCVREYI